MTTYAPIMPSVAGNQRLACVALRWTDNPGASLNAVKAAGESTAQNFKRLSNGKFNFTSTAYEIAVPFEHYNKNVGQAVTYAKAHLEAKGVKAGKDLTYAMVNNNAGTGSHSVGDTSNILDTLATTFYHEIGRDDPINLGSSGAFKGTPPVYADQADGTTFMGHFASNELTASQLYGLGWLNDTQMALYDMNGGAQTFTVFNLNQAIGTNNLIGVMINDGISQKPLFLSRPKFHNGNIEWALHLGVGATYRGSERVEVFGKTVTYQGLTFTQTVSDANSATIEIKPQ